MLILSHRGYWKTAAEQNTPCALARSFHLGFGTETDLRDRDGRLVISHDPAGSNSLPADVLFEIHRGINGQLPLALNVKSAGLVRLMREILERYAVEDYFLFDMALPDSIAYLKEGLSVFTRQSEYEREPMYFQAAAGVWIDGFRSDWVDEPTLAGHLRAGKRVCIVSPELHGRDHEPFWERLASMSICGEPGLLLCTDLPEEARARFA